MKDLNDRVGMARDYRNIGIGTTIIWATYSEALDYHNKALAIDENLNDRVGMGMRLYQYW